MSQLFHRDPGGGWAVCALDTAAIVLGAGAPAALVAPEALGAAADPIVVAARVDDADPAWVLLCPSSTRVRVNGAPVPAGARVLGDRDAIVLADGRRLYFSAERPAHVTPFPGGAHATTCVRCKLPLEAGTPAVRCPGSACGFWMHQSEELPCWTYAESCAACGHPTALDAGLRWSPEAL